MHKVHNVAQNSIGTKCVPMRISESRNYLSIPYQCPRDYSFTIRVLDFQFLVILKWIRFFIKMKWSCIISRILLFNRHKIILKAAMFTKKTCIFFYYIFIKFNVKFVIQVHPDTCQSILLSKQVLLKTKHARILLLEKLYRIRIIPGMKMWRKVFSITLVEV